VGSTLAHVTTVGGTRREWDAIDGPGWSRLADELGAAVADAGGAWLTIRSYDARPDVRPDAPRRHFAVAGGRCTVIVDPLVDGRERFAEAMRRLPPSLVWELAYGELVFDPTPLAEFGAEHVRTAIEEFHGRRRRFGGLEQ